MQYFKLEQNLFQKDDVFIKRDIELGWEIYTGTGISGWGDKITDCEIIDKKFTCIHTHKPLGLESHKSRVTEIIDFELLVHQLTQEGYGGDTVQCNRKG